MLASEQIDWSSNESIDTTGDHEVISVEDDVVIVEEHEQEVPTTTTTRTKCPVGPRPLQVTVRPARVQQFLQEESMLKEAEEHVSEVTEGMALHRVWVQGMLKDQDDIARRLHENDSVIPHWLQYDAAVFTNAGYDSQDEQTLKDYCCTSDSEEEEEKEGDAYLVRPRPDEDPASLADGEYVPPPLKKQRK